MNAAPQNIIISRTDSIGDVVLTLPMAAVLKQYFPSAKIAFIGKAYTKPVILACEYVDAFIDREDFLNGNGKIGGRATDVIIHVFPDKAIAAHARKAGIPLRIGTTNRIYHWTTCNKLVKLSRRNSDLHEAQLNLRLLEPFGYSTDLSLQQIGRLFGLTRLHSLPARFSAWLDKSKYNLVLHPKSQGSAREWGLDNFIALIDKLDKSRYNILVSGTAAERKLLQPLFDAAANRVTDITGQLTLEEFISFIDQADGLLANSTGPLHIAAALGKDAFGIYPPMRPIHPGRWAPLGPKAKVFVLDKFCTDCKRMPAACHCIKEISPMLVSESIEQVVSAANTIIV